MAPTVWCDVCELKSKFTTLYLCIIANCSCIAWSHHWIPARRKWRQLWCRCWIRFVSISTEAVARVNSACRCVHLPYGEMLCDPVGCELVAIVHMCSTVPQWPNSSFNVTQATTYTPKRWNKRKVTFTTIYFVAVTVGLDSSSVIVAIPKQS